VTRGSSRGSLALWKLRHAARVGGAAGAKTGVRLAADMASAFHRAHAHGSLLPGTARPRSARAFRNRERGGRLVARGEVTARATWYTTKFRDLITFNSFSWRTTSGARGSRGGLLAALRGESRNLGRGERAHLLLRDLVTARGSRSRPEWRAGLSSRASPRADRAGGFWWSASMLDPFVLSSGRTDPLGRHPERAVPGIWA